MQLGNFTRKTIRSLITFLHVQLFLTLISMPILVCWGMPLSVLSFAGNFFFGPILTAFLLLCSLIFFCQILYIPNGILIYALEKLTHGWLAIMQLPSFSALVALPKPPFLISALIIASALFILHCKQINTPFKSILAYSGALIISGLLLTLSAHWSMSVQMVSCNAGEVTIIYHHKQLIVIDPGVIGQRINATSWCEYTLMPHLAKEYGTTTIDALIVLQPNGIVFEALGMLLEKIRIKKIYLPLWQGKLPSHWWRHYYHLVEQCKAHECMLARLSDQDARTLYLGKQTIGINPLPERITHREYTYPAYVVTGTIDEQKIEVYSQKYHSVKLNVPSEAIS